MPLVDNISGETYVIAYNLELNFTPGVLNSCEEHNIYSTILPPNATHLMQPVDVAFFRSLKVH